MHPLCHLTVDTKWSLDNKSAYEGKIKHNYKMECNWVGASTSGKDLGVIVYHKVSRIQQCNSVVKKTNIIFGCINRRVVCKIWVVIVPFWHWCSLRGVLCAGRSTTL